MLVALFHFLNTHDLKKKKKIHIINELATQIFEGGLELMAHED